MLQGLRNAPQLSNGGKGQGAGTPDRSPGILQRQRSATEENGEGSLAIQSSTSCLLCIALDCMCMVIHNKGEKGEVCTGELSLHR